MAYKNIEDKRAYHREWYAKHPEIKEKKRVAVAKWRDENPEKIRAYRESWNKDNHWVRSSEGREKDKEVAKIRRARLRMAALTKYGGNPPKCACCGEGTLEFLSIDHINGGGNKHRQRLKLKAGFEFYRWLENNNYPEGFRVLCHNCNLSLGYYGYCPHANKTT